MAKVQLKLHCPEQAKAERNSRLASAKRYGAWLESLPLGNMTAAGNKLLVGLQEMNQTEISARQRLEMLDLTVSPVLTVVGVLDRHFRDAAFPLDEKRDRVGRVAVQFFRELALGYRLAAREIVGDAPSVGFLHKRTVARCLHHALAALEQMLYRLGLLYHEPAPQLWKEVNVLYAYARQNEIHLRTFDSDLQVSKRASIEDLYRRIALFGISDPHRLSQRAMRALSQAVPLWARRVRVATDVQLRAADTGLFEIDIESDDPPLLITDEQTPNRFALVLDVRQLRAWLMEVENTADGGLRDLSFTDTDGKPLIIDRMLIQQLLSTWGVRRRRSFQRLQAHHTVDLIVGIHAAHYILAGEGPFARFLREFGDPRFAEAASRDRPRFGGAESVEGRPVVYRAEVLNQSLGGYRLRLVDLERLQVKVGELTILCVSSLRAENPLWMMGIVRWLSAIDVREIEIGVSLLGRDPLPAALMADTDRYDTVPYRALGFRPFLEAGDGDGAPQVVVSAPSMDTGPAALCLGDQEDPFCGSVKLAEPTERTSEILIFGYDRVA